MINTRGMIRSLLAFSLYTSGFGFHSGRRSGISETVLTEGEKELAIKRYQQEAKQKYSGNIPKKLRKKLFK
jgi:hypothetical protein